MDWTLALLHCMIWGYSLASWRFTSWNGENSPNLRKPCCKDRLDAYASMLLQAQQRCFPPLLCAQEAGRRGTRPQVSALLILFCQLSVHFCLDLGQLQLDPQCLSLLQFQGPLGMQSRQYRVGARDECSGSRET